MTASQTAKTPRRRVAYFCMEFGLDASLHTYAGGLGILAGDILKGARDDRLPMVGVGILWRQGYVDQQVGPDGQPYESYRVHSCDNLEDTGITVSVTIRQRNVQCKVWRCAAFGNAPLYLLDTHVHGNADSEITDQLYALGGELRVAQEMVLGIGGVRALQALGIDVDVYHFNEGHALFAGLELIRQGMDRGESFEQAVETTRQQVVFTTHTPIAAGNEAHPMDRILYMGANQGLTIEQLTDIGGSPFNMTAAALRLSRAANAVARLHGETARGMWAHLDRAPRIIAITNGIHIPSWVSRGVRRAKTPKALWSAHQRNKRALMQLIEARTGARLSEDVLTIGFSRRAALYKRGDLVFRDMRRLKPLLQDGKLQIVWSGKSYPADDGGRELVARIVALSRRFPDRIVFLPNYDMTIGAALTRGADIWLNTPQRPLEASGTSGMKAAMNGVPNLSTLDGWWPEACRHGVNGWQFGDGVEFASEAKQARHDLKALFDVLQGDVIPTYYGDRKRWLRMMRASMTSTRVRFGASRMLKQYYRHMYGDK